MDEKTFNIPLRSEFRKVPRYKRAKKASAAARQFLIRHMKTDDVKMGKMMNLAIWERGIKNPPHHIKVHAIKDDKGVARAELVGYPIQEEKKEKEGKSLGEKLGLKKKGKKEEDAKKEAAAEKSEKNADADAKTTDSEAAVATEKPASEAPKAEKKAPAKKASEKKEANGKK
jgi:large subunit ribosomal protein L31e